MPDNRPMSAFPNLEEFLAAHPEHDEIHAYVVGLADSMPDEFPVKPTPDIIESLAYMVTGRNYGGAYLMGGAAFLYMLLQEFQRKEWYEECSELVSTMQLHGGYFEPFHAEKRAEQQAAKPAE